MDDSQWMPPEPGRAVPPPPPPGAGDPVAAVPEPADPWARPTGETPTGQPITVPPAPDDPDGVLVEPVAAAPAGRRRSKALLGGAVVAVLAVGGAGVFAVQQYTGNSAGGAASPSELGTELMAAIENEDVLGMVDTLLPGERDVMRQPLIDLVSELTRLELLSDDADLSQISGFDVEFEGSAVSTRGTNVDDIVQVDMTADATVRVDGSLVPIGDLVTDYMDPEDVTEMRGSVSTESESFDVSLTAVEFDGRWYFSLFHTAAESIRASLDPVPPVPAEGIGGSGGQTPEAAFDLMLERITNLDLRGVIETLNPGEAAALQRYAPLFLDEVEQAVAEVPVDIEITSRELRVEGDGDTSTVFVDALAGRGTVGPEGDQVRFEFSFDGDCVTASVEGDFMDPESFEQCASETATNEEVDELLADAPELQELVTAIEETLADMEPVGLEMRRHEGEWYFSPTTTITEAVLKFLRALDRDEIDRLIDLGRDGIGQMFDVALGGMGAIDEGFSDDFDDLDDLGDFDDEFSFDDEAGDDDDGWSAYPDESSDITVETLPGDVCYSERDTQTAIDCFQQHIAAGDLDPISVPVELRYPECGYAEMRWSGAVYDMSDEEFIAAAEAATPCFLDLLASGAVEEWELPYEITRLECFEGRNWYNTLDDPDYDDRYWACITNTTTNGV